jgi:hypothetical protein
VYKQGKDMISLEEFEQMYASLDEKGRREVDVQHEKYWEPPRGQ